MAKLDQMLLIDPVCELRFQGPFTAPVTSYLKLKNPTNNKICFKIKTTAPKKYCVRPNCGTLNPKQKLDVAVSLQPFDFDPTEKNKHKFMVQTMIAPEGEVNLESLWKDVTPENLMDTKFKCIFEMPVEENTATTTNQEKSNAVEDKTKRVGDVADFTGHDGELVKAAEEVKHLREEESSLRQENLQLKEELMRLRTSHYVNSPPSDPAPSSIHSQGQANFSFMVVLALVMAIVGIIIDKYIL